MNIKGQSSSVNRNSTQIRRAKLVNQKQKHGVTQRRLKKGQNVHMYMCSSGRKTIVSPSVMRTKKNIQIKLKPQSELTKNIATVEYMDTETSRFTTKLKRYCYDTQLEEIPSHRQRLHSDSECQKMPTGHLKLTLPQGEINDDFCNSPNQKHKNKMEDIHMKREINITKVYT